MHAFLSSTSGTEVVVIKDVGAINVELAELILAFDAIGIEVWGTFIFPAELIIIEALDEGFIEVPVVLPDDPILPLVILAFTEETEPYSCSLACAS